MTNPYARPDQPQSPPEWEASRDATIPLVPEQGYAERPSPWSEGYEQTAVDPLGPTGPSNYTNPSVTGQSATPSPEPAPQRSNLPPAAPHQPAPPYQSSAPVYEQPPQGYSPYGQPQDGSGALLPASYPTPAGYPSPMSYPAFGQLPEHPNAVPTLVLALLGFMFPITFPIAWFLGAKGTRETRDNPNRWRPSTMMTAGRVVGIVGTVLMLLGIAAFILFMFALVVAA